MMDSKVVAPIRLGTCSWSYREWIGKVYTTKEPTEFIREYAKRFNAVEIDSTFYGIPRIETIQGWRDRASEGFLFAAKAPQTITHAKFLIDCEKDINEFLAAMQHLGDHLGPILFQFPYFAKAKNVSAQMFMDRLGPFLACLPASGFQFAVEVRNKTWLGPPLFRLLKESNVTLALIDHPYMYRPKELMRFADILTGPFAYIRLLGDRYAIERITKSWGETVVDRRSDIEEWARVITEISKVHVPVFGFVNSHYSGYAPADVEMLLDSMPSQENAGKDG
ncbi:MAG: DUF72 domain-containing protein [Candidatus Hydrogenedentes bacterium]|nr:DUF72 domain-containing protein [Candidatus Hydrogenedentota bacterium]